MIQVQITRHFDVHTADGERLESDELHAEGERLMGALLDLEACNDHFCDSVTATDANRGTVLVELLVTAANETAAFEKSRTICRTAIHAIGGATPWEAHLDPNTDYRPRDVQLEYV
jgi:hypothetical protein